MEVLSSEVKGILDKMASFLSKGTLIQYWRPYILLELGIRSTLHPLRVKNPFKHHLWKVRWGIPRRAEIKVVVNQSPEAKVIGMEAIYLLLAFWRAWRASSLLVLAAMFAASGTPRLVRRVSVSIAPTSFSCGAICLMAAWLIGRRLVGSICSLLVNLLPSPM